MMINKGIDMKYDKMENSMQDKELQDIALKLFTSRGISVEDSYRLAVDFMRANKNSEGLDIVAYTKVKCKSRISISGGWLSFWITCDDYKDLKFEVFQIVIARASSNDWVRKELEKHVRRVLNEHLYDSGKVTGVIDLLISENCY